MPLDGYIFTVASTTALLLTVQHLCKYDGERKKLYSQTGEDVEPRLHDDGYVPLVSFMDIGVSES